MVGGRMADLLLEHLPYGVISFDQAKNIVYINNYAVDSLSIEQNTWTSKPLSELFQAFRISIEDLDRQRIIISHDKIIHVQMILLPLQEQSISFSGFLLLTQTAEEIRAAQNFVAVLGSELRTPLTVVRGFVELLLRETAGTINDDQRDFLKTISARSIDALHIIDQCIVRSNLNFHSPRLFIEAVNITQLIQTAVNRSITRHDYYKIKAETSFPSESLVIDTDQYCLDVILTQIIDNAFRATPSDGLVKIRLREDPLQHIIEVEDTGDGIPEEQQAFLFEPFRYIAHSNSSYKRGFGIGLSMVKECLKNTTITTNFKSIIGQGTIVSIIIPNQTR